MTEEPEKLPDNVIYIDTPQKRDFRRWQASFRKKQRTPGTQEHSDLMAKRYAETLAEIQREREKNAIQQRPLSSSQFENNVIKVDFENRKRIE